MKAKRTVFMLLICGIAANTAPALADETVALSDTPAAVQKTIQSQVADGKMGDIIKCAEDLDTVYDVDMAAKDGFERFYCGPGRHIVERPGNPRRDTGRSPANH